MACSQVTTAIQHRIRGTFLFNVLYILHTLIPHAHRRPTRPEIWELLEVLDTKPMFLQALAPDTAMMVPSLIKAALPVAPHLNLL